MPSPSDYTHRVTVCVPIHVWSQANHLACAVGEHADDIRTFQAATHTKNGVEYSCIHTPVKDIFVGAMHSEELPEYAHTVGIVDRAAAHKAREWALDGTIEVDFISNTSTETGAEVLARMGFTAVQTDDSTHEEAE